MGLDLVIRGGTVVDGTGAPPRTADIGVRDGRIVEIGRITSPAGREIAADGAIVTPGFIDPHTHYDGQATWDAELRPSSQHGITTAFLGNCGVGFAPLRAGEQDVLVRLMEGVEDIPGVCLTEGMRWNWSSFPDYLDVLDAQPRAIDIATQVPHDPVRLFVMGERAANREAATDADIEAMRDLVRQALAAGAFAFSTGRTDNHRTSDGKDTPSSVADARELAGIASVLKDLPYRTLMAVSDFDQAQGEGRFDPEFDLIEGMAAAAGRPLTLSTMQRIGAGDQWRRIIARAEAARSRGLTIRLQCAPRGIGTLLSLSTTFNPLLAFPSYHAVAALPLAERARAMMAPEFLERLSADEPMQLSKADNNVPPVADMVIRNLPMLSRFMFPMGSDVDYEPTPDRSIGAVAQARGMKPIAVLAEALAAEEGRGFVYFPIYNYLDGSFGAVETILRHPLAQLGLGDAGAHVATICDGAYSTFFLAHWTRDRTRGGRLSLEEAVRMMTGDQADHFRLGDRGRIAPGMRADLNVIDMERLRLKRPFVTDDLPAGGKRLLQEAEGYLATLVAGRTILEHDRLTGERPGRLLRAGNG